MVEEHMSYRLRVLVLLAVCLFAVSCRKQQPGPRKDAAPESKTAEEVKTRESEVAAEPREVGKPAREAEVVSPVEERTDQAKSLVSDRTVVGVLGAEFGAGDGTSADGVGSIADAMGDGAGLPGGPGSMEVIKGPKKKLLARKESAAPDVHLGTGFPGGEGQPEGGQTPDAEDYDKLFENKFLAAVAHPLSTFSIDVDTASYSNVRRFINGNGFPPADAVRIEELVNYFDYDYELPAGTEPFAVETEISECPWSKGHRLVSIGLQGKTVETDKLPPASFVFLLDVSGSMSDGNKLPLLKAGLKLLVKQLRDQDRVAIVVYAGAAGVVLPSTPGTDRNRIMEAMDQLQAGGSTAGGAGIKLAYEIAKENFVKEGNNRVILATDGDFNVGTSSTDELVKLIELKRNDGIFLTVLGLGMGNYKDSKMEQLANKGNGNYAYIDDILEAKKVLVTEMGSTLLAIAKDVKIQVEFNPTRVKEYRLVGYENRMLKKEDFADDTKDAGELGAGHTVTALYEIKPVAAGEKVGDDLKYTKSKVTREAVESGELMTVKLRYKAPDGDKSKLIEKPVKDDHLPLEKTSQNFRFSAAVAEFGLLLRGSRFKGEASWKQVLELARGAKGEDRHGYRAEFIQLVEKAELLAESGQKPGVVFERRAGGGSSGNAGRTVKKWKANISSARSFVGGKIDKKAVNKYLRARSSAFHKCYMMVARRNPNAGGKLALRIKIGVDGRATARVVSDKTGDPALAKCIVGKLRQWSFPKPQGKSVEFVVPFVFRAL